MGNMLSFQTKANKPGDRANSPSNKRELVTSLSNAVNVAPPITTRV